MKKGEMIKWTAAKYLHNGEIQWYTRRGIVIKKGPSDAYQKSIFILTLSGEQVILPEDSTIIEILDVEQNP
jgi:hypothetical protein